MEKQTLMTVLDVLMYLGLFILMQIIGSSLQLVGATPAVATAFGDVLIVGLFLLCKWSTISKMRIQNHTIGGILLTVLLGFALFLPTGWLSDILGVQMPASQELMLVEMMKSPLGVICLVILAPLIEELVFRGAILRRLLIGGDLNPWIAIAISSLLFAVVHGNIAQGTHAFVVGMLMGWLFVKTGSIMLGMIVHLINNGMVYVFYIIYSNPDITVKEMLGGNDVLMYSAVAVSTLLMIFCIYKISKCKLVKFTIGLPRAKRTRKQK